MANSKAAALRVARRKRPQLPSQLPKIFFALVSAPAHLLVLAGKPGDNLTRFR